MELGRLINYLIKKLKVYFNLFVSLLNLNATQRSVTCWPQDYRNVYRQHWLNDPWNRDEHCPLESATTIKIESVGTPFLSHLNIQSTSGQNIHLINITIKTYFPFFLLNCHLTPSRLWLAYSMCLHMPYNYIPFLCRFHIDLTFRKMSQLMFCSRRSPVVCCNGCVASSQTLATNIGLGIYFILLQWMESLNLGKIMSIIS